MPDMYKGKIPIIKRSLDEGFIRGTPDLEPSTGCVPRDFKVQPVEMRDSPSRMVVYPQTEWDARWEEAEAQESSLEHLYLRGDKPAFAHLDQDGFPDCWAHSTAHAIMFDALKQNLPVPQLNGVAAATLMGRIDGGWSALSMQFAREKGYPVMGTGAGEWPQWTRNKKHDTPEMRANMKRHQDLEDWYDLSQSVYDQDLTASQLTTCSFDNNPSPVDYNRFSHAILQVRVVRVEKGVWAPLILNSWQGWGYHGLGVLLNMWPDNSVSLRASTPSS